MIYGPSPLRLSEFTAPGGRAIYFRLQNLDAAVEDELLKGGRAPSH